MTEKINIHGQISCTVRDVSVPKQRRPYIFESLNHDGIPFVTNWEEAVEWAEMFNSFCRNILISTSKYQVGRCMFGLHTEHVPVLEIEIDRGGSWGKPFCYFYKHECAVVYSKMSKILNRCDLLEGQQYEALV